MWREHGTTWVLFSLEPTDGDECARIGDLLTEDEREVVRVAYGLRELDEFRQYAASEPCRVCDVPQSLRDSRLTWPECACYDSISSSGTA